MGRREVADIRCRMRDGYRPMSAPMPSVHLLVAAAQRRRPLSVDPSRVTPSSIVKPARSMSATIWQRLELDRILRDWQAVRPRAFRLACVMTLIVDRPSSEPCDARFGSVARARRHFSLSDFDEPQGGPLYEVLDNLLPPAPRSRRRLLLVSAAVQLR